MAELRLRLRTLGELDGVRPHQVFFLHDEIMVHTPAALSDAVIEYAVNDKEIKVVDIPPGLTHSIENTGEGEMLTLFWANEIFDPTRPDTYFVPVIP